MSEITRDHRYDQGEEVVEAIFSPAAAAPPALPRAPTTVLPPMPVAAQCFVPSCPNRSSGHVFVMRLESKFLVRHGTIEHTLSVESKEIGTGFFGKVLALSLGADDFAAKVTRIPEPIQPPEHHLIVQSYGQYPYGDKWIVLMERCKKSDIPKLNKRMRLKALLHVAQALQFLHEQRIVHKDLKWDNVLRVGDVFKLGDFGISGRADGKVEGPINMATLPPEVHYARNSCGGSQWTRASDIFQLGLMMKELRLTNLQSLFWECTNFDPLHRPKIDSVVEGIKSHFSEELTEGDLADQRSTDSEDQIRSLFRNLHVNQPHETRKLALFLRPDLVAQLAVPSSAAAAAANNVDEPPPICYASLRPQTDEQLQEMFSATTTSSSAYR